ncbi:MarR family transcriptional regulator [Frankia sp. CNm7]|nr:MarR family transcriptional regulator [Frankia nepalensis]MBL7513231.1 MarR family transcriptional regulator [Frankia nepalensis]MBL7524062.1 MarR family transcriptional regulator [Frankia nepalensis]
MTDRDGQDADDRFGAALGQVLEVAILINEDMTKGLARDGLTEPRAHLVWELSQRGPSTQRVLADALRVSPRNITGLIDGLVATGFVTREPHPSDRRATLVTFTEQGTRAAAKMAADHREFAELLFAGMSDAQFDGLVAGLDVVLARLRAAVAAAWGDSTTSDEEVERP